MKYLVPVTASYSGHITVEIAGPVTAAKKKLAAALAESDHWDGVESIEARVFDLDFGEPEDVETEEDDET